MKVCLLGGSNSVLSQGISKGLAKKIECENLALGASSSIQNIYELIRSRKKIEQCDFIVTESNVNDSFSAFNVGISKEIVLENISNYYHQLAIFRKPVISIILPIKRYHERVADKKLVSEINSCHIKCINKYGFDYINLSEHFEKYNESNSITKYIIPDPLHVAESFMYQLGVNISEYAVDNPFPQIQFRKEEFDGEIYQVIKPISINALETTSKKNSRFSENILVIDKQLNLNPYKNSQLVGIGTWCNGNAQLLIEAPQGNYIRKNFNNLNSFNEFECPIDLDQGIRFTSLLGKVQQPTELSVKVPSFKYVDNLVQITGLLLKFSQPKFVSNPSLITSTKLQHLIPDEAITIKTIQRFLSQNSYITPQEIPVKNLRNAAIELEDKNLKLSYSLMKLAHKARASGFFIRSKLNLYEKNLRANQKTTQSAIDKGTIALSAETNYVKD